MVSNEQIAELMQRAKAIDPLAYRVLGETFLNTGMSREDYVAGLRMIVDAPRRLFVCSVPKPE